ncbi:hypothetical protein KKE78_02105, partial [Patescibacteria group bacterium]|nr:hypothetical protein [Patescibacteria group bacterium]
MVKEFEGGAENSLTQIKPVLDRLETIDPETVKLKLTEEASEKDSVAGIVIEPLPELESVSASDRQEYEFYAARVGSGEHVNPHVHFAGEEPYRLIAGKGVMHIGTIGEDNAVVWQDDPIFVKSGETIIVKAGQVHSFEVIGEEPVIFIFSCPESHLNDDQDRLMTTEHQNGFPEYRNS